MRFCLVASSRPYGGLLRDDEYKEKLEGMRVTEELENIGDRGIWVTYIDIDDMSDMVKLYERVGEFIYSGDTLEIYDDGEYIVED